MKNLNYYSGVLALASSLLLPAATAWAASPPNINADIDWNEGDNDASTYGSTVDDIMAAYNNARRNEETQLGLSANTLGNLELPPQVVWDDMTDDAKALFLINAERTARSTMFNGVLGLPLAGVEQTVDTVAETYANLLHNTDETGHFQPSGDSSVDSPFLRVNNAVGVMCRDFLPRSENLAYFSASSTQPIGEESIPLPLERAIYSWIYDDASSQWGHREAVLLQEQSLSEVPQPGFDNNHSDNAHEGFLGFHVIGSTDYTPFGTNDQFPFSYGVAVVMNVYDPAAEGAATELCNHNVTLRTEDLPVVDGNLPPIANDDNVFTSPDRGVDIQVLNNDFEPEGSFIDYLTDTVFPYSPAISDPENGSVELTEGMSIDYTPDAGFSGVDTFTYTIIDDQGASDTATVTVTVGGTPIQTLTAGDDSGVTAQDEFVLVDVLANDSIPGSDTPPLINAVSEPANGSAFSIGGGIRYTPENGFNGTDSFTYSIADGQGGTGTATVTVTVGDVVENQAPTAANDSASTDYETAVDISVLNNDNDPDAGDTLSVSAVGTPNNGSANENGGVITYTPANGFSGEDSFTYTIGDGNGGSDTATVTVTVGEAPNQAPTASDDSASTDYETAVDINVLNNDSDPDAGDTLSVSAVGTPGNGSANEDGGVITYTPADGFSGEDSFTYTISDGNDGSDTATVTVTVGEAPSTGENQAPDAVDDAVTTRRNRNVLIDLLGNDSDADGDALSIVNGTNPANGRLMRLPNDQVVYIPNRRFFGTDSFTYTISDGNGATDTATVTIDVRRRGGVNRPPRARADLIRTRSGQSQTIDVLANDFDREGDSFRLLGGTTPRNGTVVRNEDGTITYTPNEGFRGRDNFRYMIVDEHGGVAQGLVRVRVRR